MPHPTNNLKPVIEVRVVSDEKTSAVEWHLMWNHVAGPGAACEATSGCFTLSVDQVTCKECLAVDRAARCTCDTLTAPDGWKRGEESGHYFDCPAVK